MSTNAESQPKPSQSLFVPVPCEVCKGTGKKVFPPDKRGLVNVSPCPKCEGRKIFRGKAQ